MDKQKIDLYLTTNAKYIQLWNDYRACKSRCYDV